MLKNQKTLAVNPDAVQINNIRKVPIGKFLGTFGLVFCVTDAIYTLDYGPGYTWKAVVSKFQLYKSLELQMTGADANNF